MKFCSVNGIQQNHIETDNRGLAYGDGLFTTAKILNGKVQFLKEHVNRLIVGCEKLGITAPEPNELNSQLVSIAKNYSIAVLKVIVLASSGGRGYARSNSNNHDVIIMVFDYPNNYDELVHSGINLGISKQRIGINPMLFGLKHLNRLEQVLLRKELSSSDVDDLLVANINEEIIEATSANFFFLLEGKIYTPDITHSGVDGIMRQTIIKHYPDTIIKSISQSELRQVDAMFICNCVMGIMPIANFNGNSLSIDLPLKMRTHIIDKAISHQ